MKILHNAPNVCDGLGMLRQLRDEWAAAAFLDPQYRVLLDRLSYGNEGDRQSARALLPQMTEDVIVDFVAEITRVLKPSGHLFLWMDKYILVQGHWRLWMPASLSCVDMIAWNKCRSGMGYRSRARTEFLLVLQKRPRCAKGIWKDHGIDDCWLESADRSVHPHAKPIALTQRLIRCVTKPGDRVIDPAAGSYGVLEACRVTGRVFVGCDVCEVPGVASEVGPEVAQVAAE